MNKLAILLLTLLMAGCWDDEVVARRFPKVPEELMVACPDLQEVDPNTTKLSTVISVVAKNYGKYHDCKDQVDAWIKWYRDQKKNFEEVK